MKILVKMSELNVPFRILKPIRAPTTAWVADAGSPKKLINIIAKKAQNKANDSSSIFKLVKAPKVFNPFIPPTTEPTKTKNADTIIAFLYETSPEVTAGPNILEELLEPKDHPNKIAGIK